MNMSIKSVAIASLLTLSILGASAFASSREFCSGFERGYVTGYKKAKGSSLDPLIPLCPLQPLKGFGDPESDFEHGYTVGYDKGIDAGSR